MVCREREREREKFVSVGEERGGKTIIDLNFASVSRMLIIWVEFDRIRLEAEYGGTLILNRSILCPRSLVGFPSGWKNERTPGRPGNYQIHVTSRHEHRTLAGR